MQFRKGFTVGLGFVIEILTLLSIDFFFFSPSCADLMLMSCKQKLPMQLNCYISHYEWELAYCDIKKLQLSGNVFTTVCSELIF